MGHWKIGVKILFFLVEPLVKILCSLKRGVKILYFFPVPWKRGVKTAEPTNQLHWRGAPPGSFTQQCPKCTFSTNSPDFLLPEWFQFCAPRCPQPRPPLIPRPRWNGGGGPSNELWWSLGGQQLGESRRWSSGGQQLDESREGDGPFGGQPPKFVGALDDDERHGEVGLRATGLSGGHTLVWGGGGLLQATVGGGDEPSVKPSLTWGPLGGQLVKLPLGELLKLPRPLGLKWCRGPPRGAPRMGDNRCTCPRGRGLWPGGGCRGLKSDCCMSHQIRFSRRCGCRGPCICPGGPRGGKPPRIAHMFFVFPEVSLLPIFSSLQQGQTNIGNAVDSFTVSLHIHPSMSILD